MSVTTQVQPASEKQHAFIKSLCKQKGETYVYDPTLTGGRYGTASQAISDLLAQPNVAKKVEAEPETGIYKVNSDGTTKVYKVYKMVHGSGRQGVKGMSVKVDAEGNKYGEFNYIGLASKHLPEGAVKMDKAEAVEYGKIYGFCVRCGKTLTDDKSIARGMGKWCSDQEW